MFETAFSEAYEFFFCATQDGILIAAADGSIERMNAAAAAMLGISAETACGRLPADCFSGTPGLIALFTREGDAAQDVALARKRVAAGMARTLTDGRRVVLLSDVTEQRALDSRREELVNSIAHDLRNPLGIIAGYADLVNVAGELNEDQQQYLAQVQQTTNRLLDISERLVDLAWMEAEMPFEQKPVQLERVIEDVLETLGRLAAERNILLTVSIQESLPPVLGDPQRLYLLLYELVHNALIYSPEQTTVTIQTWRSEGSVSCSIVDSGMGIAPDDLDSVFDRMFRSPRPEVQQIPGGGLGLTIARTIVRRHGGDIWATSTPGEGSTFTFTLPAAQK